MTTSTIKAERKIALPTRYPLLTMTSALSQGHGDAIYAGLTKCRGKDLDDPEAERDLGNLAYLNLKIARHVQSHRQPRHADKKGRRNSGEPTSDGASFCFMIISFGGRHVASSRMRSSF